MERRRLLRPHGRSGLLFVSVSVWLSAVGPSEALDVADWGFVKRGLLEVGFNWVG
jgi:hypothetical protein